MRTGLIIALSVCCLLGHSVFGQDEQQAGQQVEGNAWLRFTHGYSAGGPVDVYVDNLPTASWNWVPFRQVTAYKPLLAGQHSLTLIRANATRMGAEEGQNGQQQRQEELRPLSEFFSSEDILFNATFELNERTYYSLAWFAEQQQQQEEQQTQQEGEQQNRQEGEQQMEGLVRETDSWTLYIDSIETEQGQVRIRWIHLVPEFQPISVFFQRAEEQSRQEEQAIAENLSFPNASDYMTLEAGLYTIIIRRAQQGEEGQQEAEGEQQDQRQEAEELRRIERVQLLADNVYTGWVLGPLQGMAQEQEMSEIAAVIKFDNFELLREMSGQNSQ